MEILIGGCHAVSNYHELAIADGKVVGLIFGRVKRKFVLIDNPDGEAGASNFGAFSTW
jgi:hypothetical protein